MWAWRALPVPSIDMPQDFCPHRLRVGLGSLNAHFENEVLVFADLRFLWEGGFLNPRI